MKIQVPFLTVCLVGLTNLELVLGAPSPFPGIAENSGDVAALGHKSYITGHPVQYSEELGAGSSNTPQVKTPRERWQNKKHSRREQFALEAYTARPKTIEDVEKIPVEDFHKIKHQEHLSQLDDNGIARLSDRMTQHFDEHQENRRNAFKTIKYLGGEPGKLDSGSPEAEIHHKAHANAQRALNELNGPLKAVDHAARVKGLHDIQSKGWGRRLSINGDHKSVKGTNEDFDDYVGKLSTYHSYGKLPRSRSQPSNQVKEEASSASGAA